MGSKDSDNVVDGELLQEASLALRALRLRREAAWFEAEATELEAILERAKGGDRSELERWLARHRMTMGSQSPDESSRRPFPVEGSDLGDRDPKKTVAATIPWTTTETRRQSPAHVAGVPTDESPWHRMVLEAERRALVPRPIQHSPTPHPRRSPPHPSSSEIAKPKLSPPTVAENRSGSGKDASRSSSKQKESARPVGAGLDGLRGLHRSVSSELHEGNRGRASSRTKREGTAGERRIPIPWRKGEADRDQATRVKGLPGWWLSLGLHAVLVPLLALVTYRLAEPPSVGLTASPGHEEPFAFDAPVPIEVDQLQVDAEPVESISSELAVAPELSSVPGWSSELAGEGVPAIAASSRQLGGGATTGLAKRLSGAQFFGSSAEGNTFCFVVDSSGSMRRMGAFEAAKTELMRSIRQLKSNQRYYIFFFSEEVDAMTLQGDVPESLPVYPTPENLERTARWVQRVPIRGGRPPNDALDQAIELAPDAIFLLFDGETKVDVAAHLRQSNRVVDLLLGEQVKVPIHTLGFYTRQYEASLQKIAEENGGSYQYIPPPAGAR
jgi:hypothetical protein